MRRQRNVEILERDGNLLFITPYSAELLADLKASVPPQARRFDGAEKAWIVSPQHARTLLDLAQRHFGVSPTLPRVASAAQHVTRLVKLEYLGVPKERGGDEPTAFGFCEGDWSLIFPLSVLKRFFCDDSKPGDYSTLYAVLGIQAQAQQDEIKKAYRRAARTYHPDVNKEPDAPAQFRRIQEAYELLSDSNTRARYDAGLRLQAMTTQTVSASQFAQAWRPPLRCGILLIEGALELGRVAVETIHNWQDITDGSGRVMVSYWPAGGDKFEVRWQ